jgi:hypothetical protein
MRIGSCAECSQLELAMAVPAVPGHLELRRSGFANDPLTGSRVDRFSCRDCGTEWLLENGPEGTIVDWYKAA